MPKSFTNEDMVAWVAGALLLYNFVGLTDANASSAFVEAASSPGFVEAVSDSLKIGLTNNIDQVKHLITNSESAQTLIHSPTLTATLSNIQGAATNAVIDNAQVAGENVKVAIDKIKDFLPGRT